MTLTPLRRLGSGDLGTAYLVRLPDGSLRVYKVDNHPHAAHLKQELYQYAQLRQIGFPVAIHDDLEYFINDPEFQRIFSIEDRSSRERGLLDYTRANLTHGYHLREYLPEIFPEYGQVSSDSALYDQAEEQFSTLLDSGIEADYQRRNVGLRTHDSQGLPLEQPQVVYYDLMPLQEDDGILGENPFEMIRKQCLKTFAPEGTEVYKKLDPSMKKS
jgi:hypothetical protein